MTVAQLAKQSRRVPMKDLPASFPTIIPVEKGQEVDVDKISKAFLDQLAKGVESQDWDSFGNLFNEDSWWKDSLTLTFDKRTLHGRDKIVQAWKTISQERHVKDISFETAHTGTDLGKCKFDRLAPQMAYLEVPFSYTVSKPDMTCIAMAKLTPTSSELNSPWVVWVLTTNGVALKEHPFSSLPMTHNKDYISIKQRGRPIAQGLPLLQQSDDPLDAIVIGGNSSGLANAIELESIGARSIVVDCALSAGGSWSDRYENVTLHHPAFMSQLPKFPVPSKGYPDYLTGRDLARYYSEAIEKLQLPFYAGVQVISNHYDQATKLWSVKIKDVRPDADGHESTLFAKNIIFSNGFLISKENMYMPKLDSEDAFKGSIRHTAHVTTTRPYYGKDVVIVGTGNSAHDIANMLCQGDDPDKRAKSVTMIQRSPTVLIDFDIIAPVLLARYSGQIPVNTADFLQDALPIGITRQMVIGLMAMLIQSQDALNAKLEEKGYLLDRQPDLMSKAYEERGKAFYMDHLNTFELVLQDKVKIRRGEAIGFTEDSLVIRGGNGEASEVTKVKANAVILATGYETIDLPTIWAKSGFLDDYSASLIENVNAGGVDEEGELPGYVTDSGREYSISRGKQGY